MIECNNVIPKIIVVNEGDEGSEIISQFAHQQDIEASHRIVVRPEKDGLTVDQIHLMKKDIQVSFSKKVLVVLQGVDDSSSEVQNSLLKCIEEDSERILFLFLVKNPNRLLSTVLSRCAMVETGRNLPKLRLSKSDVDIFSFKNNSEATKEEAVERIDQYIQYSSLKDHKILRHLLKMRKLIMDNNMNPVLALDNILIFLSKTGTMKLTHEK